MISCSRTSFADAGFLAKSNKGKLAEILVEVQKAKSVKTVKQFLTVLYDMMKKLVKTQKKHRKISIRMMKQCKDEGKFRKKAIKDGKCALDRATKAYNASKASLNAAKKLLPRLKDSLKSFQAELKRIRDIRKKQHAQYLKDKANWSEGIAFLKDFIKYVKANAKNMPKAVFVQYGEKLLHHAASKSFLAEAMPVLVTMNQHLPKHGAYKYTPPTKVAKKLMTCLVQLLNKLKKDLDAIEKREKKRVAIFLKYQAKLVSAIGILKKNIKRTEKQIRDMTVSVKKEKGIMLKASKKIARNTRLMKAAKGMCARFAADFVRATKNRLAEVKCIQVVLKICKKRFGQMPKDLVSYLEQVKNGWIKYVNSTEFHKFKVYKRKHIKDNKTGRDIVLSKLKKHLKP